MDSKLAAARRFASTQHHAITFQQAKDVGMSATAVSRMAGRGWVRVYPGVYLTEAGAGDQLLRATLLWAGDSATLSHRAAGWLHGLDGVDQALAEVTLPLAQSARSKKVAIHRSDLAPADRVLVKGMRTTSPARTLIDLAAVLEPLPLAMAVEHAWRMARVFPKQLRHRLEELGSQGRPGAARLNAVLADCEARARPLESALEVLLWHQLKVSGLPLPQPQFEVRDGRTLRVDFAYPDARLAIEADGVEFHAGDPSLFEQHCARHTRLAVAGWRVLHFTRLALHDAPACIEQIRRALADYGRGGRTRRAAAPVS